MKKIVFVLVILLIVFCFGCTEKKQPTGEENAGQESEKQDKGGFSFIPNQGIEAVYYVKSNSLVNSANLMKLGSFFESGYLSASHITIEDALMVDYGWIKYNNNDVLLFESFESSLSEEDFLNNFVHIFPYEFEDQPSKDPEIETKSFDNYKLFLVKVYVYTPKGQEFCFIKEDNLFFKFSVVEESELFNRNKCFEVLGEKYDSSVIKNILSKTEEIKEMFPETPGISAEAFYSSQKGLGYGINFSELGQNFYLTVDNGQKTDFLVYEIIEDRKVNDFSVGREIPQELTCDDSELNLEDKIEESKLIQYEGKEVCLIDYDLINSQGPVQIHRISGEYTIFNEIAFNINSEISEDAEEKLKEYTFAIKTNSKDKNWHVN